jgi:DNA-binding MarR family transcriptional regulator
MNALRRIVRGLRVSSRSVERAVGISGAQLFVLRQLAIARHCSLKELVARTLTHQSTVSEVVARLVERGLVSRRAAADDARRAELALTAPGRALLRTAPPSAQSALVAGFGRLGATQRRGLADGLESWLDASGLAGVEAAMFFEGPESRASKTARGTKAKTSRQPAATKSTAKRARGTRATSARSGRRAQS